MASLGLLGNLLFIFAKLDIFKKYVIEHISTNFVKISTISMNKKASIFICLFFFLQIQHTFGQYQNDILGNDFECMTLPQKDDYEGKVVATLIRKKSNMDTHKAILYVHGYNDYFFQKELAEKCNENGYNFYAVDLRKYGRSILPNQDTFFCKKISEYFPDIDSAIAVIKREGNNEIMLMAHSTGGLITPLYLESKIKAGQELPVKALVLNSPFLDWNESKLTEVVGAPILRADGTFFKKMTIRGRNKHADYYAQSLHKSMRGEWNYDLKYKLPLGHPKMAGWCRAIDKGHSQIHKGLHLTCPILVMSSDTSIIAHNGWKEEYKSADIVLDVNDIHKYGDKLGNKVTHVKVKGGVHDLLLSKPDSRAEAYKYIFDWLKAL